MNMQKYESAKQLYSALLSAIQKCRELDLSPDAAVSHIENSISSEVGGFVIYLPKELSKCKTQL